MATRRLRSKKAPDPARVLAALERAQPQTGVELDHRNAWELLVATILAAQSTDERINQVTPALFERYADANALAVADPEEVEKLIFSTGFYRNKTKSIIGMSQALVEDHAGEVPQDMKALCKLPGVARKTANVVLGVIWQIPSGIVIDTHGKRLSQLLGFTHETDAKKIERDLMEQFPQESWIELGHRLTLHGRRVCLARKPKCHECELRSLCPSAPTPAATSTKKRSAKKPGAKKRSAKKRTSKKLATEA